MRSAGRQIEIGIRLYLASYLAAFLVLRAWEFLPATDETMPLAGFLIQVVRWMMPALCLLGMILLGNLRSRFVSGGLICACSGIVLGLGMVFRGQELGALRGLASGRCCPA